MKNFKVLEVLIIIIFLVLLGLELSIADISHTFLNEGDSTWRAAKNVFLKTTNSNMSRQVIFGPTGLKKGENLVLIIINADIYNSLAYEIGQYAADIQNSGFQTVIETVVGGTPRELRDEITTWKEYGLAGVVGVGDLPIPLFKLINGSNTSDVFPCHLFYEDIDGEWIDTDGDGIFDIHQDGNGDRDPEIWFGVISFSSLKNLGSEIDFFKDYFERNHSWRTLWPTYSKSDRRALVYLDDAIYDTDYPDCVFTPKLQPLYGENIKVFQKPIPTTKTDYLDRLQEEYEIVCIESHASPSCQAISESAKNYQCVEAADLLSINPKPYFYDLVGCNALDYRQNNNRGNIGAAYLASNGLVVWGVAKGGGGFQSDDLFTLLATGSSFGEAWISAWDEVRMASNANCEQYADAFTCMHSGDYGRVLMGDPTLFLWRQSFMVDKCAAILSNDLNLHVPIAFYGGQPYAVHFQWAGGTAFILTSATPLRSDTSLFDNCTTASVTSDLSIYIPVILYNNISYWADLQYSHDLTFTLRGTGRN